MNNVGASCQACRFRIIGSFAALAGLTISKPSTLTLYRIPRTSCCPASTRSISSSPRLYQQSNIGSGLSKPPATKIPPSSNPPSIPWYLQVQTPVPPAPVSPHLAFHDIPPIPSDAPPIVSPILAHLSTNIGLDNLTLLDLRDVYPPPALGANLIMIVGTARSYKHLNTSADRFCRWLRSMYKLTPYADGLLGRNEMKLKLRRKARRMKLAQSVGNTVATGSTEGGDDGITTGWICVNVGPVDEVEVLEAENEATQVSRQSMRNDAQEDVGDNEDEYTNPPDDSGVIGFGSRDMRPRIVVQMFTEEKRLEVDLEGLYDFRAQRRSKKEAKLENELQQEIV